MNQTQATPITESMAIPMAVDPKSSTPNPVTNTLLTEAQARSAVLKRDRAFFSTAMQTATISLYRSAQAVSEILLDARLTLSPEEFQKFIREDCKFDSSLVYKFIKMAADYRLNDPANRLILPEAYTARYEIMTMKEETFRIGVTRGIIHPNCKLADLRALRDQLEPNRKKASDKPDANATAEPSTALETAEGPKLTPTKADAEEQKPNTKKAAVKAPVNSSALQIVKKVSATEPVSSPTATEGTPQVVPPLKGHITIVMCKGVADQHKAGLDRLKEQIEALVKDYDFIGAVELEVAA